MFNWRIIKGKKDKAKNSQSETIHNSSSSPELVSVVAENVSEQNEAVTVVDINENGQRILTREIEVDTNLLKTSHIRLESVYDAKEPATSSGSVVNAPVTDVTGEQTVITVDWKVDEPVVEVESQPQAPVFNASNFLDHNGVVDNFEMFSADETQDNWFGTTLATASHDLFSDDNSPFEIYRSDSPEGTVDNNKVINDHDLGNHEIDEPVDLVLPEIDDLIFSTYGDNELPAPEKLLINQEEAEIIEPEDTPLLVDEVATVIDIPVKFEESADERFFLPNRNFDQVTAPTFIHVEYTDYQPSKKRKVEVKEYPYVPHKHFDLSYDICTMEMKFDKMPDNSPLSSNKNELVVSGLKRNRNKSKAVNNKPSSKTAKTNKADIISENLEFLSIDNKLTDSDFIAFKAPEIESLISPDKKHKTRSSTSSKSSKKIKHEYKVKSITDFKKNKFRKPELIFDASN